MTVTSKVELSATTNITYPALFKSNHNGDVVLFTGLRTGTLVAPGENSTGRYPLGHQSANWNECTGEETWKRLPLGTTVTLTQE